MAYLKGKTVLLTGGGKAILSDGSAGPSVTASQLPLQKKVQT